MAERSERAERVSPIELFFDHRPMDCDVHSVPRPGDPVDTKVRFS